MTNWNGPPLLLIYSFYKDQDQEENRFLLLELIENLVASVHVGNSKLLSTNDSFVTTGIGTDFQQDPGEAERHLLAMSAENLFKGSILIGIPTLLEK